MRSAWSGKSSSDAEQRVAAGDVEQEAAAGAIRPAPTTRPTSEHQRRVAAVAGTERVAHAHDVPLAGGVAPRQAVVLGDDRQLVGGPLGEAERGGVGERPAGAVGGARRRALEAPRLHPRPHAQPVLGPHEPVRGRALGVASGSASARAGRRRGWRRRRRRRWPATASESTTAIVLAAAHRPPPQQPARARSVTTGGPTASSVPPPLREALAAGVGDDRLA